VKRVYEGSLLETNYNRRRSLGCFQLLVHIHYGSTHIPTYPKLIQQ